MAAVSEEKFSAVLKHVSQVFKIQKFKENQEKAVFNLVNGKDVLVLQPTGSGKSIIFQCFPLVFDALHGKRDTSCALVISPLTSLMQDQVAYLTSLGVRAAFVGDEQSDETVKKKIEKGEYQIVFGSPESFLGCSRWRSMLSSVTYREKLSLIAIDEAHCIQHW